MTATQAERDGYLTFTGIYGKDSQEVSARIAKVKDDAKRLGLKLRIIKASEVGGFSAYADGGEYAALQKALADERQKKIYINEETRIRGNKTKAVEEARVALAKAEKELAQFEADLADAKANLK
jgi:hypothetical protein